MSLVELLMALWLDLQFKKLDYLREAHLSNLNLVLDVARGYSK